MVCTKRGRLGLDHIYVLNEINTVTSHGNAHMKVILIYQTIKLRSSVALTWSVIYFFDSENKWTIFDQQRLDIIGHMFYYKFMLQ